MCYLFRFCSRYSFTHSSQHRQTAYKNQGRFAFANAILSSVPAWAPDGHSGTVICVCVCACPLGPRLPGCAVLRSVCLFVCLANSPTLMECLFGM